MDAQPGAGRAAAKTAHLRSGALVLRNTLDPPFKLKWPEVNAGNSSILLQQLKSSFSGLRPPAKAKRGKRTAPAKGSTDSCESAPPSKRPHLEASTSSGTVQARPSSPAVSGASTDSCTSSAALKKDNDSESIVTEGEAASQSTESTEFSPAKCSQVVVGINAVTRQLEKDRLRCGLVCLSATPSLMHRHILMLAATRGAPFAALSGLSEVASPLLGVKSALALGIKKLPVGESPDQDHFSDLLAAILRLAPPIRIPWLTVSKGQQRANTKTGATTRDSVSLQVEGEHTGGQRAGVEGPVLLCCGDVPVSDQVEGSLGPPSPGLHARGTDSDRGERFEAVGKAGQTTVGVKESDGTTVDSGPGEREPRVQEEECHRGCEEGGVREEGPEKIMSGDSSSSHLVSRIMSRRLKRHKKLDHIYEVPNVEYFPLNIKKTIVRQKRTKK